MRYENLEIARQVRDSRVAQKLSQRGLSKLSGVPQAQISRIESGQVDLRLSSLVALASALNLEIALVPRRAMPALNSILGHFGEGHDRESPQPAYTLDEDDDV